MISDLEQDLDHILYTLSVISALHITFFIHDHLTLSLPSDQMQ